MNDKSWPDEILSKTKMLKYLHVWSTNFTGLTSNKRFTCYIIYFNVFKTIGFKFGAKLNATWYENGNQQIVNHNLISQRQLVFLEWAALNSLALQYNFSFTSLLQQWINSREKAIRGTPETETFWFWQNMSIIAESVSMCGWSFRIQTNIR